MGKRRRGKTRWQYDPAVHALIDTGIDTDLWSGSTDYGKTVFHSSGGSYTYVAVKLSNSQTGKSLEASSRGAFTKNQARETAYRMAVELAKSL